MSVPTHNRLSLSPSLTKVQAAVIPAVGRRVGEWAAARKGGRHRSQSRPSHHHHHHHRHHLHLHHRHLCSVFWSARVVLQPELGSSEGSRKKGAGRSVGRSVGAFKGEFRQGQGRAGQSCASNRQPGNIINHHHYHHHHHHHHRAHTHPKGSAKGQAKRSSSSPEPTSESPRLADCKTKSDRACATAGP